MDSLHFYQSNSLSVCMLGYNKTALEHTAECLNTYGLCSIRTCIHGDIQGVFWSHESSRKKLKCQ